MPIKKYCKKCSHELKSWSVGWYSPNCGCFEDVDEHIHEPRNEPFMIPMTNADKIRSMNDRELCEFLCESVSPDNCGTGCPWFDKCGGDPYCFMVWMKSKVD